MLLEKERIMSKGRDVVGVGAAVFDVVVYWRKSRSVARILEGLRPA